MVSKSIALNHIFLNFNHVIKVTARNLKDSVLRSYHDLNSCYFSILYDKYTRSWFVKHFAKHFVKHGRLSLASSKNFNV